VHHFGFNKTSFKIVVNGAGSFRRFGLHWITKASTSSSPTVINDMRPRTEKAARIIYFKT
jgi:hypothetical protein